MCTEAVRDHGSSEVFKGRTNSCSGITKEFHRLGFARIVLVALPAETAGLLHRARFTILAIVIPTEIGHKNELEES